MIKGLGIDICEIARMEKAVSSERFLTRVFTAAEREHIARFGVKTAAGIFAAKEAAVKALGTGFDGFFADSVEITHDENGRPGCVFHGKALEAFEKTYAEGVFISITHDAGIAAAVAVIE